MKRFVSGFFVWSFAVSFWAAFAFAQAPEPTPADLPPRAEQAFAGGNFTEAVGLYAQVAQHAPCDPNVLYNLGTAYARQGDLGRAAWRYLQAMEVAPRDEALRHNLGIVLPNWRQDLAMTPIPPLNTLYWWLTVNEWTGLAMGGTLLGLLLLAARFWTRRAALASLLRGGAIVAFVVGLLCWPPALLRYNEEHRAWRGVIVEQAEARIGPNATATSTFSLTPGRVVRIESTPSPGWLKVSFAGDRVGFIERDQVEFL